MCENMYYNVPISVFKIKLRPYNYTTIQLYHYNDRVACFKKNNTSFSTYYFNECAIETEIFIARIIIIYALIIGNYVKIRAAYLMYT